MVAEWLRVFGCAGVVVTGTVNIDWRAWWWWWCWWWWHGHVGVSVWAGAQRCVVTVGTEIFLEWAPDARRNAASREKIGRCGRSYLAVKGDGEAACGNSPSVDARPDGDAAQNDVFAANAG